MFSVCLIWVHSFGKSDYSTPRLGSAASSFKPYKLCYKYLDNTDRFLALIAQAVAVRWNIAHHSVFYKIWFEARYGVGLLRGAFVVNSLVASVQTRFSWKSSSKATFYLNLDLGGLRSCPFRHDSTQVQKLYYTHGSSPKWWSLASSAVYINCTKNTTNVMTAWWGF